jgi:hypothetical protein
MTKRRKPRNPMMLMMIAPPRSQVVRKSRRRALSTEITTEPHASTESTLRFGGCGLDDQTDLPATSVISSRSPQYGEARQFTEADRLIEQYISWRTERVEQLRRDLRPDGAVIAHFKDVLNELKISGYVLELRLAMRPMQIGPHKTLFMSGS